MMLIPIIILSLGPVLGLGSTLLFNGAQSAIFTDATTSCLTAFNTSLDCDPLVQLLSYDMDRLELTEDLLTALCTSSCSSSLVQLESAVSSSCGSYELDFNGAYLSAVQVVDLFTYKYNMSCLADSSGAFCLMVEESWDIAALNNSGNATWPMYTNKTYPNFDDDPDNGTPTEDIDGNLVDNSNPSPSFSDYGLNLSVMLGQDYYQDGISMDYQGHGWPTALDYDEYPLEIQCSECFLAQYKLGIESQWGEVYDEVSDQVWENVRQNCEIEWQLAPANNLSTWPWQSHGVGGVVWSYNMTCGQTVTYAGSADSNYTTANDLALENNVATAALLALNNQISWNSIPAGSYCAPASCQVAIINETTSATNYVGLYDNVTATQFWQWNNYMEPKNLVEGEVVCVGPPGGAYTPVSATQAYTTVYTTTATPAEPTPSGTTPNCGLYYGVVAGDSCNNVTLHFSITLDQFYAMNPSLFTNCSNLLTGIDYCVATVVATTTSTAVATSTAVPAPTQTVTGTTSTCYEWYVVQSGDSCENIEDQYGITLAYFRSLNTYVDAACDNIWADYAYCVNGVAAAASSSITTTTAAATTTTAPTSTRTYVAAPTSTVSGTTDECYEWYVVQSGDSCEKIDGLYDITLDYFISLNTYVDSACDNIWPDYAYCVDGIAE
ncbi:hypothetical protein VM1G_02487 [Cytospora mali]|uniref:LysM domain-containing protein n=1 Tax=Cytospora mali TaxID=578113 RepID=A0A194VPF7_CYTMA|nr:hypothetical protein VM1G_02487 [Valsa mali]